MSSAGFTQMRFDPETSAAKYPGDPALRPLAKFEQEGETFYFYPHAIVAVVDAEGNAEFSRMD